MKKLLLPVFACLFILAACDNTPKYQISGTVSSENLDGKTVFLRLPAERGVSPETFDSAIIVKNVFEFKGVLQKTDMYYLAVDQAFTVPVFLEAAPIKVSIDSDDASKNTVTGSPFNDLYYIKFTEGFNPLRDELMSIQKSAMAEQQAGTMTAEKEEKLMAQYDEVMNRLQEYVKVFINENPNNLATALVLQGGYGLPTADIRAALDKFDSTLMKSSLVQILDKRLIAQEEREAKEIKEGQQFVDLRMLSPEGKEVAISDYAGKGKIVLLDFWASWCGPCRQENPNVVKAYAAFKKKGFEIVGVSLDKEKEKWIAGIKEDKITWPQMSDLKVWQSEAVAKYGIQGIPFTVLLDKEGKVIAKNLRGKALEDKLHELLD